MSRAVREQLSSSVSGDMTSIGSPCQYSPLFLFLGLLRVQQAIAADASRVTSLYSVDPVLDRNHDAFIRIGDLAPEWWLHSTVWHETHG